MNHLLYDLSGNLSYSDEREDAPIELKKCHHCKDEVEKLSVNYFCNKCQAECDQVDWEETMDIIIRSI